MAQSSFLGSPPEPTIRLAEDTAYLSCRIQGNNIGPELKDSSMMAHLHIVWNCYTDSTGKKVSSGLSQIYILPATRSTFQIRGAYWCSSGMDSKKATNWFLIEFVAQSIEWNQWPVASGILGTRVSLLFLSYSLDLLSNCFLNSNVPARSCMLANITQEQK